MKKAERDKLAERWLAMSRVLEGKRTLLVVMQDFPDPDAIAAAAALRELAKHGHEVTVTLSCGGFVGRAENRALLKYLGLNIQPLGSLSLKSFDAIAMVDTQPGAGNNGLADDRIPDIVIDHHPMRTVTRKAEFYDVRRRYGSTSTMLYEYLQFVGIEPPVPLATALLYGLRSDTADLGREAVQADIEAYLDLYPVSNKRMLGRIAMARVPRAYFQSMATGLKQAQSSGNCVFTVLGAVDNPDIVAEIADLLLRDEQTDWAMCIGAYGGQLLISLRTSEISADAGKLMQRLVSRKGTGGGHRVMAGGQINIKGCEPEQVQELAKTVVARYIRAVGDGREPVIPVIQAPALGGKSNAASGGKATIWR